MAITDSRALVIGRVPVRKLITAEGLLAEIDEPPFARDRLGDAGRHLAQECRQVDTG